MSAGTLKSLMLCLTLFLTVFSPIAGHRSDFASSEKGNAHPFGKATSPLVLTLTASALKSNSTLLTLQVTSRVDLESVQLEVNLPPEFQAVSGGIPPIDTLQENQTKEYQLVIAGHASTPTRLKAEAHASLSGRTVGAFADITLVSSNGSLEAVPESLAVNGMHSGDLPTTSISHNLSATTQSVDVPGSNVIALAATITARGKYVYPDHLVTPSGVAATAINRPFRQAQVQIQRQTLTGWSTVASGYSADDGTYSFSINNINVGTHKLRSRICTTGPTSSNKLKVRRPGITGAVYCYISQELIAQTNTNFGTRLPFDTEAGAGPVNIYDTILEAYGYVTRAGGATTTNLVVLWSFGYDPSCGSCYSNNAIQLNGSSSDGDQWDDSIIAHEFGHWVMDTYADRLPDSGGPHSSCNLATTRPNLAYSEGWAHFFGSASRSASRNPAIRQWSSHSIDTGGGIGSTQILGDTDLETVTEMDSTTGRGNFCEWQVAGTLWDVFDANADGTDILQRPFGNILRAARTKYNSHFPYNINEWWYGWTNTLGNRSGVSLGFEQEMLDNFAAHNDDIGVKFILTWGGSPADIDSHLWLPSPTQYHVRWNNKGTLTSAPYAALDVDVTPGFGPETLWLVSPYVGPYIYAVFDWTDQLDDTIGIAGSNATVKVYDGSQPVNPVQTITVSATGEGFQDWWHVLALDGGSGAITIYNVVQTASPGPYAPGPFLLEDEFKE